MNLYSFYRRIASQYSASIGFVAPGPDALKKRVRRIGGRYFDPASYPYVDAFDRVAYTFSFAPRHAHYWKELSSRVIELERQHTVFNAIGLGPGSEVIGILEGAKRFRPDSASDVTVYFTEQIDDWLPVLQIVAKEYAALRGIQLRLIRVTDESAFARSELVVGSYILSELIPQGCCRTVLERVRGTAPTECIFLDRPVITNAEGDSEFVSNHLSALKPTPVRYMRYYKLSDKLGLGASGRREWVAAGSSQSQEPPEKPSVFAYHVRVS